MSMPIPAVSRPLRLLAQQRERAPSLGSPLVCRPSAGPDPGSRATRPPERARYLGLVGGVPIGLGLAGLGFDGLGFVGRGLFGMVPP
jgi:hypothetical protein